MSYGYYDVDFDVGMVGLDEFVDCVVGGFGVWFVLCVVVVVGGDLLLFVVVGFVVGCVWFVLELVVVVGLVVGVVGGGDECD